MEKLRSSLFSRIVALLTGLVFLNMSFFLSEVRILDLQPDNIEIIVKILLTGIEEENDGIGEPCESGFEQIVDFNIAFTNQLELNNNLLAVTVQSIENSRLLLQAFREIATPPPREA